LLIKIFFWFKKLCIVFNFFKNFLCNQSVLRRLIIQNFLNLKPPHKVTKVIHNWISSHPRLISQIEIAKFKSCLKRVVKKASHEVKEEILFVLNMKSVSRFYFFSLLRSHNRCLPTSSSKQKMFLNKIWKSSFS
jgi:hypothetical protein